MSFVSGGIDGSEAQRIVQASTSRAGGGSMFHRAELNGLIEQALRANPDIQAPPPPP
jgi:outer membrane protein TolC